MVLNNRRKKLCFGLLPVLFITFLFSLSVCSDVNAFSFGNVSIMQVDGIQAYGDKGGNSVNYQQYVATLNSEYKVDVSPSTGVQDGVSVTRLAIDLYNRTLPAGSLFTINLRFQGLKTNLLEWSGQNFIILDKYCVEVGNDDYNCTLWGYNSSSISNTINIFGKWYFDYGFGYINTPVQFNFVAVTADAGYTGLTQLDKDYLSQQIQTLNGQLILIKNNVQNLYDPLQALRVLIQNQGASQQETLDNIEEAINEQNEREEEAIDNISNQSPSDIPDSESQQTTSIINFVGSFVTALGTVQPSSCELTLPFPQFAGGTQVVNICNGKQYAPSIIAIGGSLLLIGTFIPLAYIVLRLIFNEIRSWTNG